MTHMDMSGTLHVFPVQYIVKIKAKGKQTTELLYDNIKRLRSGRPLVNQVPKDRLY
jgi:hypothetical protein